MVIDMGYWTKVSKRILVLVLTIIGIILSFKLAVFYMPFLIAFIISLLIEPLIKFVNKKTSLTRKSSAIIVLVLVSLIIIGLLVWGITAIISEATNLLQGLNTYIENAYNQVQNIISGIDFNKLKIPEEVTKVIQNSLWDFIGAVSNWVKNFLTSLMNLLTEIPTIAIYVGICLVAIYFMCTDKLYMLDQLEHHLPKEWVKRIGRHRKRFNKQFRRISKSRSNTYINFIYSIINRVIYI